MSTSQSPPLSSRLLGLGRRTTLPVQPAHSQSTQPLNKKFQPSPTLDAYSALPYHPAPRPDPLPSSLPPPPSDASLPPRHQRSSPTDSDTLSPYIPTSSSRGGRLNELLSPNRSRSSSAASSPRPTHSKHPSASLSSTTSSSSPPSGPHDDSEEEASSLLLSSTPSSSPRSLLKQGPLRKRSPKGLRLWQSRYLWLYSDALHYGKSQDSRTLQGRIPLGAVKFVLGVSGKGGKAGSGGSARFDVVVGEESIQRAFHFEARDEREAEDWVRHIAQAVRAATDDGGSAPHTGRLSADDKFWKAQSTSRSEDADGPSTPDAARPGQPSANSVAVSAAWRRRTDGLLLPSVSRLSTTSYVPTNSTPSLSASPVPPSPSPITPIRSPALSDTGAIPRMERGASAAGGEVRGVEKVLEAVEAVDMHRIGRMFLCREKARPDVWHLLHAVPRTHPQADAIRTAHSRMAHLHLPHLLTPLCHSHTADALFAVYTPALRPVDLLLSYLQAHRRLPELVVRHIAVHVLRSLTALHACGYHYRALSPASLAFDGDGAVVLIDPLFSLPPAEGAEREGVDAEYQLPAQEGDGAAGDWWRLGVLLYELAVGLPPVRAKAEAEDAWMDVAGQLTSFHPLALPFPPFVSPALQSLIRQLLMIEADTRIGCGEGGDAELRAHPFFADIDWTSDASPPPPTWVKQHVQRQTVRMSLGATSVSATAVGAAGSTPTSVASVHQSPSVNSAFTFSPVPTPPGTSQGPFFPSSLVVAPQSPYEAYLQQKPPRNVLSHPPPPLAGASLPPSSLRLTILGGRNFPPPHQEAAASTSAFKRRTLDAKSSASLAAVATHGVFIAVSCAGELRVSRMVVGVAACQPQFGDEMAFALAGDGEEVGMDVRWGRIGSALNDGTGHTVGSASVSVTAVQALCSGGAGDIWHSVIDASGLVVGELHVRYSFDPQEDRSAWWVALRTEGAGGREGRGRSFKHCFGRALDGDEVEPTQASAGEPAGDAGQQRKVQQAADEEANGCDVRVHLSHSTAQ